MQEAKDQARLIISWNIRSIHFFYFYALWIFVDDNMKKWDQKGFSSDFLLAALSPQAFVLE